MNVHLIASLLIVAITAVVALLRESHRTDLDQEHVVLKEEAAALGLPVDGHPASKSDLATAAAGAGATKGARAGSASGPRAGSADPKAVAREFAQELIAFATKMKEWEKRGEEPSREDRLVLMSFMNRFLELDPEVIPHLMAEIRAYTGLEEKDKRNILMFSMMSLSQSSPERALDLYVNSGDLFGDGRESEHMVGMALGSWAKRDPIAVLSWLELHGPSLKAETVAGVRTFAIASSFNDDPASAIDLALKLDREQLPQLAQQIGKLMQTPEDQLGLLRRVQDQLGDLPANLDRITPDAIASASNEQILRGSLLNALGGTLANQGFDSAREFLDTANLTATETSLVAHGLAGQAQSLKDPGAWIPWLHSNSPASQRDETVSNVVESWTRTDFRATAEWIGEQAPGPLRELSTYSFAETVAPHEPASAAEWALTLPASDQRTELLQGIHAQWRAKDQEAADAFAAEQGLNP